MDNKINPAAVYYERGTGEALVYGSSLGAGLLVLIGLVAKTWPALAAAAIAAAAAYYFHPMVIRRPALMFDAAQLHIQGIGTIDWTAIRDVRRADRPLRSLPNPILIIDIAPEAAALLKRRPLTRPAGRLKNSQIEIQMQGLKADPDALTEALTEALESAWRHAG